MHTIDEIKSMTDEEVAALNKNLAKKGMQRFALFFLVKWTLLVALNRYVRTLRNSKTNA